MSHEPEQSALDASERLSSEQHQNASKNHITQLAHQPDTVHSAATYQLEAMTLRYRGRQPQTINLPYRDRPDHNLQPTLSGHHSPPSSSHNSKSNFTHAGLAVQDIDRTSPTTFQPTEQPQQQAQSHARSRLDHYSPPRQSGQRGIPDRQHDPLFNGQRGIPTERWNCGWYDHYCPSSAKHIRHGEQGQVRERHSLDALICTCPPPKGRRYR